MKNVIIFLSTVVLSAFMISILAWSKGNTNEYEIKTETDIMYSNVEAELGKAPEPNKEYFYKTVVIETVSPGKFPGTFESKLDTITHEIMSKSR